MKSLKYSSTLVCFMLLHFTPVKAEIIYVSSLQEFNNALDNAETNDSIIWHSGIYSDIDMDIRKDDLYIGAENLGGTIFTGGSKLDIFNDRITFEGFQFLGGDIGTDHVINIRGSHVKITQVNIRAYTCYKYLRVREESQFTEITYCNFENRLNLDDQNILSILVDDDQPGYHKVQYCSFKNFDGTGGDLGIEPIRIGVSTQADFISRSLVEFCYFTQCNGDGEIISSKATQNVYRFNTFENNPKAELVLRHGSEAIVYGNFFLKGKGGVRVREGQDHYIYNNYFQDLDDRAIILQNDDSDPLSNINIAFNTITDCSEVILGGNGSDPPTQVTFANNIFSNPIDDLFEVATGTETWIGNIAFGSLGITMPALGMTVIDPQLEENSEGFLGLAEGSPAINASENGYAVLPQFEGMDIYDTEILFDMMGQERPSIVEERDLGANEYPYDILIQPIATEENTGPSYNTSMSTSIKNNTTNYSDFISIFPNPVNDHLNIAVETNRSSHMKIRIFNAEGLLISKIGGTRITPGKNSLTKNIANLPPGLYVVHVISQDVENGKEHVQSLKFQKVK